MRLFCYLLVGLISFVSYSQDSNSKENYLLLSQRKDSLLFSFFSSSSESNILLETDQKKDLNCNKINSNDSQSIIDVFYEMGVLETKYLIPADNPKFDYSFNDATKLLIIIGRDDFDYYLVIREVKLAKEVLTKIGNKLGINNCFNEFKIK